MSDDFDFGFSAVSTEEFQKTQTTTEEQPSAVSTEEFDELKKKMDASLFNTKSQAKNKNSYVTKYFLV